MQMQVFNFYIFVALYLAYLESRNQSILDISPFKIVYFRVFFIRLLLYICFRRFTNLKLSKTITNLNVTRYPA